MAQAGFSASALGHAFISIRAIAPSPNLVQRLNSIDALLVHKTMEENVEEFHSIGNFGELIHPTPFKHPEKRQSIEPIVQEVNSTPVIPKVLTNEPDINTLRTQISRSKTLSSEKSLTSTLSMGNDKVVRQGILKKGPKSRFAQKDLICSYNSEGSVSRVTIQEREC